GGPGRGVVGGVWLGGEQRRGEGRHHEHDRQAGGELAGPRGRARGAEPRLVSTASERRADVGALPRLQQDEADDDQADENVHDDDQYEEHAVYSLLAGVPLSAADSLAMAMKLCACRLAPPTRTPSTSSSWGTSAALSGLTLPP